MFVKLRFKRKNGQLYGIKEEITVKEANKIYKRKLEKDNDIIEVYLLHFDGWHTRRYKQLKGGIKC